MQILNKLPRSTPFWVAVAFAVMALWAFLALLPTLFALTAYSPERQATLALHVAASNMLTQPQELPPAILNPQSPENAEFQELLAQQTAGRPAPYAEGYAAGFAAASVHAHAHGIVLHYAAGLANIVLLMAIIALVAWYYHRELRQTQKPSAPANGAGAAQIENRRAAPAALPAEQIPAPVPE